MTNSCILIPVFNEEIIIKDTISSLLSSGFLKENIYIVDDCSTDRTSHIALSMGVNVYTPEENGGKARAQVSGLEHFNLCEKYDWVIFLDGDTKISPSFKSVLDDAAKNDPDVALFVGQVKSSPDNHIYSAIRAVDYTVGQNFIKEGQNNCGVIFVSPGCASMYRTDVLKKFIIAATLALCSTDVMAEPLAYPGSAWFTIETPATNDIGPESGNWVLSGRATQGVDVAKFDKWTLTPYITTGFVVDTNGLDYNNRVTPGIGLKLSRPAPLGVIEIGVRVFNETRFGSKFVSQDRSSNGVQGYVSYWGGWGR